MPDQLDADGKTINPDQNVKEGATPFMKEVVLPKDEEPSFSKKQMEQLATLVGRISKKQLDENVIPLIQARREEPIQPQPAQNDAIKAFNETLQQKIFDGDVLGAIQMATDVQTRARDTLTKTQVREVEKNIVSFSDKPFYKDIHSDMDKIAKEAIAQGVPPDWAAEHAYHKALSDHLSGSRNSNEDGSLDMIGGGKQRKTTKEPKLPDNFKAAFERDKDRGLVKDEKEWIALLSPKVRAQIGI